MEEIDTIRSEDLQVGDVVMIDGTLAEVTTVQVDGDEVWVDTDNGYEKCYAYASVVAIYGYTSVEV